MMDQVHMMKVLRNLWGDINQNHLRTPWQGKMESCGRAHKVTGRQYGINMALTDCCNY